MKEAEIVIAVFPQADGTLKRRPALILREMPPFKDFLICGISTQLRQEVKDFDEIISANDEDFDASICFRRRVVTYFFNENPFEHQIRRNYCSASWYLSTEADTSGLDSDSLIRLGFLLVLPRQQIIGSIGEISTERHQRLLKNLSDYLTKSN